MALRPNLLLTVYINTLQISSFRSYKNSCWRKTKKGNSKRDPKQISGPKRCGGIQSSPVQIHSAPSTSENNCFESGYEEKLGLIGNQANIAHLPNFRIPDFKIRILILKPGVLISRLIQGLCRLGLEFFSNGPETIYLHQTK